MPLCYQLSTLQPQTKLHTWITRLLLDELRWKVAQDEPLIELYRLSLWTTPLNRFWTVAPVQNGSRRFLKLGVHVSAAKLRLGSKAFAGTNLSNNTSTRSFAFCSGYQTARDYEVRLKSAGDAASNSRTIRGKLFQNENPDVESTQATTIHLRFGNKKSHTTTRSPLWMAVCIVLSHSITTYVTMSVPTKPRTKVRTHHKKSHSTNRATDLGQARNIFIWNYVLDRIK